MNAPVAAIYSGVYVYEILCNNVPVMRRAHDHYVNATQVLRAAGLPKTQRTKILERDVCPGIHEKIQGGYHMFQGTWVPLPSAIRLAKDHGLEADMSPLFDFDPDPNDSTAFDAILEAKKQLKLNKPPPKPKPAPVPARWSSTSSSWSSSEDDRENRSGNLQDGPGAAAGKRPVRRPRQSSNSPALQSNPGTPVPSHSTPLGTSSSSSSNRIGTRGKVYKPPGDLLEKRRPGRPKGSGRTVSASQSPVPTPKRPRNSRGATTSQGRHSAPPGALHATPTPIASLPSQPLDHTDSLDFDNMDLMDPYGLLDGGDSSDSDPPPITGFKRPAPSSTPRLSKRQRFSSSDEDPYTSFTDDDDLEDRSCEACGTITIPTWRKGPTGRRTLCDPCGLKWCFGRLPAFHKPNFLETTSPVDSVPIVTIIPPTTWSTDTHYDTEPESPSSFLMPTIAPPPPPQDLPTQLQTLRSRIQSVDKNRKRLRRLLDEMRREDAGADRAFRRAIVRCRRAKTPDAPVVKREGTYWIVDEESEGEGGVVSDGEGSLEDETEMVAVSRFIRAVRWRVGS